LSQGSLTSIYSEARCLLIERALHRLFISDGKPHLIPNAIGPINLPMATTMLIGRMKSGCTLGPLNYTILHQFERHQPLRPRVAEIRRCAPTFARNKRSHPRRFPQFAGRIASSFRSSPVLLQEQRYALDQFTHMSYVYLIALRLPIENLPGASRAVFFEWQFRRPTVFFVGFDLDY